MERTSSEAYAEAVAAPAPAFIGLDPGTSESNLIVAALVEPARELPLQPALPVAEPAVPTGERALDLIIGTALLILVLPLMALCVIAVRLSGPGPIMFRQSRIGRGGQQFTCLKFRTMSTGAEAAIAQLLVNSNADQQQEWLTVRKLAHDPRVTTIGRFLRRYCLDELPQLFNVLAGEMSVVGPRPIVPDEIERYASNFVDYCSVKPGLTGLWQVSGRHALSYEQRVSLDARYARLKSVRYDLLILCRTVPIVIRGQNV